MDLQDHSLFNLPNQADIFVLQLRLPRRGRHFRHLRNIHEFLRDSVDILWREGAEQPKMMSIGLHLRLTGHPGRAAGLERFLDYIANLPDVWACRRIDIARHWWTHHPPLQTD